MSISTAFQLNGAREMVDEEKAASLLSEITFDPNTCTSIKLSNKSFSTAAATLLISKIKECSCITIADLSDIIAGRPEEEALKTLSVFCDGLQTYPLVEVNLSDNALGKKGIIACNSVLTGKTMEKLYLCNNGLSAEACAAVAEILLDQGCPPLKVLHFYNNMSGSDGAKAVSRVVAVASLLEDFRFSATRSGNEGCLEIALALAHLNLRKLDVSDNSFGEDAAEALAASLSNHVVLESLNLRDAGLTEEGSSHVLKALTKSPCKLTFLDMSGNDMTSESAPNLSALFRAKPSLEEVYLDDNELGNEGCSDLLAALSKLLELRVLSLCFCDLTAAAAFNIAKTVCKLPKFQVLKLDGNQICARGVTALKALMAKHKMELGDFDENDDEADDDLDDALDQEDEGDDEDELAEALEKVKIDP